MCRLALMNQAAARLLTTHLPLLCADLEHAMGGHGNGMAARWSATGTVIIHKGRQMTSVQAATHMHTAIEQCADWVLFHTRWATSATKDSKHCHPFRCGPLVLAHNGQALFWETLADSLGITDSECITRMWGRLKLPLEALARENGVFIGFHAGRPFVVKGDEHSDLTVSFHKESGAILFASELSPPLHRLFDSTIDVAVVSWRGDALTLKTLQPRPAPTPRPSSASRRRERVASARPAPAPPKAVPQVTKEQAHAPLPLIELAPAVLSCSPSCEEKQHPH